MGGKKKLSLKQMERMQQKQDKQEKGQSKSKEASSEKKTVGIIPPDIRDKETIKELKKMNLLTPYLVALRFNLRLSVAKDFLEELNHRGLVTYISRSRNVKVYKPAD